MCNGGAFVCAEYLSGYQTRGVWLIFSCVVGMIAAVFLCTPQVTSLQNRLAALYMSYISLGGYVVGLGMATANTAYVFDSRLFSEAKLTVTVATRRRSRPTRSSSLHSAFRISLRAIFQGPSSATLSVGNGGHFGVVWTLNHHDPGVYRVLRS
jgi:hypothetical protein